MAWFRLDDNGYDHDKVLAAGDRAYGVWCRAGQYSSNKRTDGYVSFRGSRMLCSDKRVWARLVSVGLLHEVDGGYQIHDYLDYNPSKVQLEAKSKVRSEAGKRGADARWDGKRDGNCHGKRDGGRHDPADAPVPSRPVPSPVEIPTSAKPAPFGLDLTGEPEQKPRKKARRATPIPDGWEPTVKHAELAKAEGRDLKREVEKFRDHALATGRTLKDWNAGFRTWLRSEFGRGKAQQDEPWEPWSEPEPDPEQLAAPEGVPMPDELRVALKEFSSKVV